MYVGLACQLLAWTIALSVPLALAGPVIFVLFITRFQIVPEERALSAKFGPMCEEYKSRVRRWI
jgi:protein-S-isoprenylcysteine O-methyltransferase Ste14